MRIALSAAAALILALLIFHAGVVYGTHRRSFGSFDSDRGFRHSFFPGGFELPHGFISNEYGAVGTVATVTPTTLLLQTREGVTQTILISTSTIVRSMGMMGNTSVETLSAGNQIIVLGEPDSHGRIDARLIRILSSAAPTP